LADIEDTIWKKYKDSGLVLWAVGGDGDDYDTLVLFKHQMGLTFPILYDEGTAVHMASYLIEMPILSPYPQDFIVGVDGTLRYVNNNFDSQEIVLVIDEELEKMESLKP